MWGIVLRNAVKQDTDHVLCLCKIWNKNEARANMDQRLLPMTEFCLNLLTTYWTAVLIMMYTSTEGTIMRLSITNKFTLCARTSYKKELN